MFSRFFISRPVFSIVISVIITLMGVVSIFTLPIEEYPSVTPTEVLVTTTYAGASAEVVAETVASVLENSINGVEGMIYMKSNSTSNGTLTITISFSQDTDPDLATINVNNRVQAVLALLPQDVQRVGVNVIKQSSTMLAVYMMYSDNPSHDSIYIANYAKLNIIDELKRIEGVGNANAFGSRDYSMRIWLDLNKLSQNNLTPSEVSRIIQEQNSQFAVGYFGQEPVRNEVAFTYSVTTQGRFVKPEEFENIIIRSNADGSSLRLKDIARVELGAQDYSVSSLYNGHSGEAFGVFLQPGANALDVAERVEKKMQELSKSFPSGLKYVNAYDTTTFIKISVKEVIKTFIEAIVLVVVIMYFFLQNFRATIIPVIAIPVSIIGAFAGMQILGFSINLLTLFGLILAIGIVVDDAIIVIENVERILRSNQNMSVKQATIEAMNEIQSPVIAIVLVLCSVFVPIAFIGGFSGEIYKQFAISIVVSVIISGFVALTLTPALCVSILKKGHVKPFYLVKRFNDLFDWLTYKFGNSVSGCLRRGLLLICLFIAILAATFGLFKHLPTGLVPSEDKGYVIGMMYMPPATALSRTLEQTTKASQMIAQNPLMQSNIMITGFDITANSVRSFAGFTFIKLKDWSERKENGQDALSIAGMLTGLFNATLKASSFFFTLPAINGLGLTGGFEVYLQDRGGGKTEDLQKYAYMLMGEVTKRGIVVGGRVTLNANIPQYRVTLDREKAKAYKVNIDDVFTTLQSTFGSYYVNDFNLYGRTYRVNVQAESEFRESPEDLSRVFVKSAMPDSPLVPISSLVSFERIVNTDVVERFNLFPATMLSGSIVPGHSSGEALKAIEEVAREILPPQYTIAYSGISYQEKVSSSTGYVAFGLGIIFVFLILAAQYERWIMPFAVILAVPFAVFGAIIATWLRGLSADIYFQVGLVTLIALSAKNAILIVEFAQHKREKEGLPIFESALQAAKLRFRPIVMTSIAFSIGVLPLALSTGAGAASRHAIGTGVIGGMLAATFIAIFFIPLFWTYCARFSEWIGGKKKEDDRD